MSDSDDDDILFGDGVDMSGLGEALGKEEREGVEENSEKLIEVLHEIERLLLCPSEDSSERSTSLINELSSESGYGELGELRHSVSAVMNGEYFSVLQSPTFTHLMREASSTSESAVDTLRSRFEDFIENGNTQSERLVLCLRLLAGGIAAFNLFLQANYTGPELEESQFPSFPLCNQFDEGISTETPNGPASTAQSRGIALNSMVVDGEMPYPASTGVRFFFLARVLLAFLSDPTYPSWSVPVNATEPGDKSSMALYEALDRSVFDERPRSRVALSTLNSTKKLISASWWSGRAVVCHQRMLIAGEPTQTLWKECSDAFKRVLTELSGTHNPKATIPESDIGAEGWLEWGLAQFHFNRPDSGKKSFDAAKRASALNVEMSAALGKRTKFQRQALPQMVLKTTSTNSVEATDKSAADSESKKMPEVAAQHEDSILLETTKFDNDATEEGTTEELSSVHLAVVLALCLDVKNSNPKDGLTTEEMRPYVERVLLHHANWTLYSTGLLQRAWLDFESYYSKDRATLQLQALVDQHTNKLTFTQMSQETLDESSPAQDRLRFLHCIVYPPRWELKKDLAKRYQELGILVSAAQLYEELELWDDVVDCYSSMGKRKEARKLVQERRKVAPDTPRMLCALGDLSHPPESTEYFERAWKLSNGRSGKAKRRLGREAFDAENWEAAERHLEDAVRVVPSLTAEWFLLGTIRMRLEKWQDALTAFSTVVCHSNDSGDAWGNIGAVHLKLKRPDLALTAFTEGLKFNRESWRMWENRLLSALRVRPTPKASDAILCCSQLLDLKRQGVGRGVDPPMLAAVTSATLTVENVSPENPLPTHSAETSKDLFASRLLARQMLALLTRITSTTSIDPKVWEVCALFHISFGSLVETRDCRLKHVRALSSKPGWEKNLDQMAALAESVQALVGAMCQDLPGASNDAEKKEVYSVIMMVKGLIRKASGPTALMGTADHLREQLEGSLVKLEERAKS